MQFLYWVLGSLQECSKQLRLQNMSWPFNPDRNSLYSREELWTGYDSTPANNTSLDWKIFEYSNNKSKYSPDRDELSAQRRHDAHIETCVNDLFGVDETAAPDALQSRSNGWFAFSIPR
jgi:hypothetical protein